MRLEVPWVLDDRIKGKPVQRATWLPSARARREVPATHARVVLLTTDEGVPNQYWQNFCDRVVMALNREFESGASHHE